MAFFCPIRVRKNKKTKENDPLGIPPPTIDMGRITGSSSLDTLVRVGLEKDNMFNGTPDSKMIVLHDFTPCVDDELHVKRGEIVNVLYQENDWVYVLADPNREGFIPHSYCAPISSQLAQLVRHKKIPHHPLTESSLENNPDQNMNPSSLNEMSASELPSSEVHPFFKDPSGKFVVLYTFIARDENDVSVERGELVTVLNKDDPDWYWVVRSDYLEGFVPSAFVCPIDVIGHGNKPSQVSSAGTKDNKGPMSMMTGGGGLSPSSVSQQNVSILVNPDSGITNGKHDPTSAMMSKRTAEANGTMNPSNQVENSKGNHLPSINMMTNNPSLGLGQQNKNPMPYNPNSMGGGILDSGMSAMNPQQQPPSHLTSMNPSLPANSMGNSNNINSIYGTSMGPESVESNSIIGGGLNHHHLMMPSGSHGAMVGSSVGGGINPGVSQEGTELVMLYDYKGQAHDDLSVSRGDWVYADLRYQTVEGWLWAFAPKLKRYGFIPKAYARPPAMTSI